MYGWFWLLSCASPSLGGRAEVGRALEAMLREVGAGFADTGLVAPMAGQCKVRWHFIAVRGYLSCHCGVLHLPREISTVGDVSYPEIDVTPHHRAVLIQMRLKLDFLQLHFNRCDLTVGHFHHPGEMTAKAEGPDISVEIAAKEENTGCEVRVSRLAVGNMTGARVWGDSLIQLARAQDMFLHKMNTEVREVLTVHLRTSMDNYLATTNLCDII